MKRAEGELHIDIYTLYWPTQSLHDQTSAGKCLLDPRKSTFFELLNFDHQNHQLPRRLL
jgi:hypothetical protein